jgi:hypothetical protein
MTSPKHRFVFLIVLDSLNKHTSIIKQLQLRKFIKAHSGYSNIYVHSTPYIIIEWILTMAMDYAVMLDLV